MRRPAPLPAPLALALAFVLALLGCVSGGNSGSETTNGLTGTVRDAENDPVPGARVLLLPEGHNGAMPEGEKRPRETRTDASGTYRFSDVNPGVYNLEITDYSGTAALVQGVRVEAAGEATPPDGVLAAPGSVEIPLPDALAGSRPGYLYIPGTTAHARVDSAARARGTVILAGVPAGRYDHLLLVIGENHRDPVEAGADFGVEPGRRTVLPAFHGWAHSRDIPVSAPSGGAAAPALSGYPLLVRLLAPAFDFSQAAPGGADLRFADAAGRPLPHEIERWDSVAGRAEVWVRLDSVAWDRDDQKVVMRWGRPGAAPMSSGPAVFAGYASVWHFAEAEAAGVDNFRDASPAANHATLPGAPDPSPREDGVVGRSKSFSAAGGALAAEMPPGLGGNASFTVSFWMKASADTVRGSALHFGLGQTLRGVHWLVRPDSTAQFGPWGGPGIMDWQNHFPLAPFLGRWTHVATVYDAGRNTLASYLDGELREVDTLPPGGMDVAQAGLWMGAAFNASNSDGLFHGQLDEVRVHPAALPPERLRLDFQTQKP